MFAIHQNTRRRVLLFAPNQVPCVKIEVCAHITVSSVAAAPSGKTPRVAWPLRESYLGDTYVEGQLHWWDAYVATKISEIQHRIGLRGSVGVAPLSLCVTPFQAKLGLTRGNSLLC